MNTVRNQARRTLVGLAAAAVAIPLAVGAAPVAGAATSDATVTMLQGMASEEKLAHDVYTTLAETFSGSVFARIASSEAQHESALMAVMSVRGIADPNAGLAVGDFASAKWENLYDSLVAKGKVSLKAAGGVGVTIEKLDISDLDLALAMKPASDITRVLQNLRSGSARHLTSFQRVVSGYTR
ncbi:MAG: DUF2202 domain-containing protein [Actinobacteria bacterium]|nr:DUF2202 domain-containing protein [Actinomycetota bacterium]